MMPHNIIIVLNYHIFVILIKFFRLFTQMHVDMFFSMLQDNPTIDILIHFFVDILHENCTFVFSQNLGKVELSMRALNAISNQCMIYENAQQTYFYRQFIHTHLMLQRLYWPFSCAKSRHVLCLQIILLSCLQQCNPGVFVQCLLIARACSTKLNQRLMPVLHAL